MGEEEIAVAAKEKADEEEAKTKEASSAVSRQPESTVEEKAITAETKKNQEAEVKVGAEVAKKNVEAEAATAAKEKANELETKAKAEAAKKHIETEVAAAAKQKA